MKQKFSGQRDTIIEVPLPKENLNDKLVREVCKASFNMAGLNQLWTPLMSAVNKSKPSKGLPSNYSILQHYTNLILSLKIRDKQKFTVPINYLDIDQQSTSSKAEQNCSINAEYVVGNALNVSGSGHAEE